MNEFFDQRTWSLFNDLLQASGQWGRAFRTASERAAGRFPPVNVFVDESAILVEAELPGKTAADVDVTLEADAIRLADAPAHKDGEAAPQPAWVRKVELPFRVDADRASAVFKDGILTIRLPKADQKAPRKISIACA